MNKLSDVLIIKDNKISNLENDSGYENRDKVVETITETITADFIEATNAKLSTAQIGELESGNLTVSGTIYANAGNIGGAEIQNGILRISNANITEQLHASRLDADSIKAKIINADYINSLYILAKALEIKNGINTIIQADSEHPENTKIGGFNINENQIYRDTRPGPDDLGTFIEMNSNNSSFCASKRYLNTNNEIIKKEVIVNPDGLTVSGAVYKLNGSPGDPDQYVYIINKFKMFNIMWCYCMNFINPRITTYQNAHQLTPAPTNYIVDEAYILANFTVLPNDYNPFS